MTTHKICHKANINADCHTLQIMDGKWKSPKILICMVEHSHPKKKKEKKVQSSSLQKNKIEP